MRCRPSQHFGDLHVRRRREEEEELLRPDPGHAISTALLVVLQARIDGTVQADRMPVGRRAARRSEGGSMSKVIVIGAGFSGSAAALMLAADGHEVLVVDRDAGPVPAGPDEAWQWDRRSIRQYRFAHGLLPRGHRMMAQLFPHLVER